SASSSAPIACSTSRTRSTRSSSIAAGSPTAARETPNTTRCRRPRGRLGASLDQAVLQRVVREVAVRLELHLLHHSRAVRAHGLHAERHAVGHVADRLALGEAQEDLELALGELLVRRLVAA